MKGKRAILVGLAKKKKKKKNQKSLSLVLDIPRVYAFSPKLTTFHTHDTNYTSTCITSKSLSL